MITLITGAPGSGKTLYCVDKLIRPLIGTYVSGTDEDGGVVLYDRRVFTNINGLLLDHELIDRDWLESLHDNKQTGAVVVFDEVQRVWPNRPNGSKKPLAVEYLETHRHDGIDIILMTQNPQLLDPAVRALVGRHLHMRRVGSFGAAVVYEWDACSNALNYKAAFRKTPYRYSRKVFKLYRSAKVHTKQPRSLPFAVWVLLGGIISAAWLWPQVLGRLTGQEPPPQAQAEKQPSVLEAKPLAAAAALPAAAPGAAGEVMTKAQYIESFQPRSLLPHSAPRYDQLTQPVRVPVPAACISMSSKGCKCFTQRGTPMEVRYDMCMQIVERGIFLDFDPEPQQQAKQPPVRADDRPPQQAAGLQPYVDFTGAVISAPRPQTAVQAVRAAAS